MCELLVHAEQIAYLSAAYADVACGNVLVRTDMAIKLSHECLAETHNFSVGASADREVRAALASAHRQSGECILECLLKSEELQDREVY